MSVNIQESGEMYLETILTLRSKLGNVRSIDIVNETGYSKPSVSRALAVSGSAAKVASTITNTSKTDKPLVK